jgi:antitoxin ParD1/3/4
VPTRNVVLTDRQASLIQSLVESGRYQNASEVVREGLRLIERREEEDAARIEALRAAADAGIADMEREAYTEFSSSGELHAHYDKRGDLA